LNGAECFVARIVINRRQGDQAHFLAVVQLEEHDFRKFIDRPDVRV
jgi:hypothetical protein